MTTYRVERDDAVVFEATKPDEDVHDTKVFPAEFRNPLEGTYTLYINDEIIGVQRPYAVRAAEDAIRIAQGN